MMCVVVGDDVVVLIDFCVCEFADEDDGVRRMGVRTRIGVEE